MFRRSSIPDERVLSGKYRTVGVLGPRASSFTLAWLATHRDRLRTVLLGGKRLSVLVVWDKRGAETVVRTDAEVDALRTVVYGPDAFREEDADA